MKLGQKISIGMSVGALLCFLAVLALNGAL
jgi:hypothetical protein